MTIPMWIAAVFFGLPLAFIIWDKWPRSGRAEYDHELAKLQQQMWWRGLAPAHQKAEFAFRRAMAKTRRLASDAAISNPAGWRDALDLFAVEESRRLALTDRDVARRFLKVVRDSPSTDILYPDAENAVNAHFMKLARLTGSNITEDDLAAVRAT